MSTNFLSSTSKLKESSLARIGSETVHRIARLWEIAEPLINLGLGEKLRLSNQATGQIQKAIDLFITTASHPPENSIMTAEAGAKIFNEHNLTLPPRPPSNYNPQYNALPVEEAPAYTVNAKQPIANID